jgi:hypothetical protein
MPGAYGRGGRSGSGFGCLGALVATTVLVVVVVTVIFAGLIALAVFAALLIIGLFVLAVDRVALALSPKRRERRASQQWMYIRRSGQVRPGQVIDTAATLDEPESDGPVADGPESEP